MATKKGVDISQKDAAEALKQTQNILTWSAYQDAIKVVDQNIFHQFEITIVSLRAALWIKTTVYIIQFVVATLVLIWSFSESLKSRTGEPWIWIISLLSLILLGVLLFRNPVQAVNHTLVDLARLQIILQGYARQINQIDVIFKQAFLENKMNMENLSNSLDHVQKVIDGNVESLLQFLEEMHL